MRIFLATFLLFISMNMIASEPLRIGVISDTHFLSEQLMDNRYAVQEYVDKSGRDVISSPEIIDQVVADYLASNIDVLLVSGDMTKDGEKQSHIDFREKLRPLYDKGVKIFVIPGNHDVNIKSPVRYQGNKSFPTEGIEDKGFREIYADYGYGQAVMQHTGSLSYATKLDESTLLLAIDASEYNQLKKRPNSSGSISKELKEWIELVLTSGKELNNCTRVVTMMHWGLAEHFPMQGTLMPDYLVHDYKNIATLLADHGVQLIFTGHFHANDISSFTTEKSNTIYDVETGALISYPFAYRFVDLYEDHAKIETRNITSIASKTNLVEESKETLRKIASAQALHLIRSKKADFPTVFSEDDFKQLANIASEVFLLHLAGDEVIPEKMKKEISDLFNKNGMPIDEDADILNFDLPPKDNNLTISFDKK